jgi:hypothetical protein
MFPDIFEHFFVNKIDRELVLSSVCTYPTIRVSTGGGAVAEDEGGRPKQQSSRAIAGGESSAPHSRGVHRTNLPFPLLCSHLDLLYLRPPPPSPPLPRRRSPATKPPSPPSPRPPSSRKEGGQPGREAPPSLPSEPSVTFRDARPSPAVRASRLPRAAPPLCRWCRTADAAHYHRPGAAPPTSSSSPAAVVSSSSDRAPAEYR